jgi:hypothetical protein
MVNYSLYRLPCFLVSLLLSANTFSGEIQIPLNLGYRLVEETLLSSVFTGPEKSAIYNLDPQGCNSVRLTNPEVGPGGDGSLSLASDMVIRGGTPVGGSCLFPLQWQGRLKVLEKTHVIPGTAIVGFQIVDASFEPSDAQQAAAPALLWQNLKPLVLPSLGMVTVDLNQALLQIQSVVGQALATPDAPPLPPLRLASITATDSGISGAVILELPEEPAELPGGVQTALTPEELAQWDANWQSWDAFATWLIKSMSGTADDELRQALATSLLEARYDLRAALAEDARDQDPVRELFAKTWDRLAPLMTQQHMSGPGSEALSFAAFMSAGEALAAIDSLAPHIGLKLDSDTLRALARLWMPAVQPDDLSYTAAVDPALRRLLGFDAEFAEEGALQYHPLAWLVPRANALAVDPLLLTRLTGWVPVPSELDSYLEAMQQLLDQIIAAEKEKGKVPTSYINVYENLVLATAWQESCWRQFEKRNGSVLPLLSSAGSVGLMQVNKNVWRGIYDPILLDSNVGYNARAGNEILVHYLVDYAIKKQEDVISGDKHNLARAAYGVYNGGPRHISRYRTADTKPALAHIDKAFWTKYQAIRKEGHGVVKSCYGS